MATEALLLTETHWAGLSLEQKKALHKRLTELIEVEELRALMQR